MLLEAEDAAPVAVVLYPCTVNVYEVLPVNPETVIGLVALVPVMELGVLVAI